MSPQSPSNMDFGRRGVLLHLSGSPLWFPLSYHRRVAATKLTTSKPILSCVYYIIFIPVCKAPSWSHIRESLPKYPTICPAVRFAPWLFLRESCHAVTERVKNDYAKSLRYGAQALRRIATRLSTGQSVGDSSQKLVSAVPAHVVPPDSVNRKCCPRSFFM